LSVVTTTIVFSASLLFIGKLVDARDGFLPATAHNLAAQVVGHRFGSGSDK
jgi:hypothetical protein